MSLSFIPLGVGDAFSTRFCSSSLALEAEGRLLVDCPHPIRKMLKEAGDGSGVELDVHRVSGVALTHLHADRSSGLADLAALPGELRARGCAIEPLIQGRRYQA